MNTVILEEFDGIVWQAKKVELDPEDFAIDDQALDANMCAIGSKLYFYSNLSATLYAQAQRKKNKVEEVYAEIAQLYRKDNEKYTEGNLKEKVSLYPSYISSKNDYIQSESDYKRVENLYKSMNKVADILISLSYKQGQELKKMGGSFE